MKGLTPALLGQACRIFLTRAYPGGESAVPPGKRPFWDIAPDQPLEPLLAPPVCQPVPAAGGGIRGYAFRLGSCHFPHVKLRVVAEESSGECIFGVDTHDAVRVDPNHPDAARWAELQAANRRLKEEIEHAWSAVGLTTFNDLLRRELEK
jgi:hypothetical protein